MNPIFETRRYRALLVVAICALSVFGLDFENFVYGKRVTGGRGPTANGLPPNLFTSRAPTKAISVSAARQNARQGQIITLEGKIGGAVKPIAKGRAIFLMTDAALPGCSCGCPTPWDSCCVPRQTVMANMVTIQIPDGNGRPLKADLLGVNGLKPAAEVVVKGTVVKHSPRLLVVDAKNIYVKSRAGNLY